MSVLQYPEMLNSKDVQVWDNEAFDNNGEYPEETTSSSSALKFSWSTFKPPSSSISSLSSQSFESDSTKENRTPSVLVESPVFVKNLVPMKPLQPNRIVGNANGSVESNKILKMGVLERRKSLSKDQDFGGKEKEKEKENLGCEDKNLDSEIEEIEKEINRLSSRLESLRLEKARRNAKAMEKRGRIVAAKFMDPPKQNVKFSDELKKLEDAGSMSAKMKTPRRGLSLGPAEIMRGARRGISLGPAEIYSANKLKQLGKPDVKTPASNRRQSCYWKLQDIDELRVAKERGKSYSLSPKSRSKTALKVQAPKQAATTIGSKKTVKKDEGFLSSVQPKKLFMKDGEKSAPGKKTVKNGRVVPSRYSLISSGGNSAVKELRKRSLPENEEGIQADKKRVSLTGKSQEEVKPATENRVKKRWDIPSEVVIQKNVEHKTPLSVSKMIDRVPKIKNLHCAYESPRDSGPAKRVSELVGRKSYFSKDDGDDDVVEESVCQSLDFAEEQVPNEYLKIRALRCIDESPRDSGAAKRVSQLVGRKSFFHDYDEEIPVFSFEEEDGEEM